MLEMPRTRSSLLVRLRGERDERAWVEFLDIYEPLILRLMRGRGLQESDARDTTQQVLLRISNAIGRYEPDGTDASFRRWLNRVTRNAVVSFLSQRSRRNDLVRDQSHFERLIELVPASGPESESFDSEYRRQVFAWAMEQVRREFKPTTWLAFVETAIHERPIAEVAAELKLSVGSVYVARSRIVARLRSKVEEHETHR